MKLSASTRDAIAIGMLAVGAIIVAAILVALAPGAWAEDAATVRLSLKDHRFQPAEARAPAGKPITIVISNLDPTPLFAFGHGRSYTAFELGDLRISDAIADKLFAFLNLIRFIRSRNLFEKRHNFFQK